MPRTKIWNKERINAGFDAFFDLHGYYPTSDEIRDFSGLPSPRTLQRAYNGIPSIRRELNQDITDYRTGEIRSSLSKEIGLRGLGQELALERHLVAHFGRHFVHTQQPLTGSRKRTDFFVYANECEFGIDIFYPKDYGSFVNCLNIKITTLVGLDSDIFLVPVNENITDADIERYKKSRKKPFDHHIHIMTYSKLMDFISQQMPLYVSKFPV